MYIDEMNTIAKTMGIMRGALSRWLLPYDNNTRIYVQVCVGISFIASGSLLAFR